MQVSENIALFFILLSVHFSDSNQRYNLLCLDCIEDKNRKNSKLKNSTNSIWFLSMQRRDHWI